MSETHKTMCPMNCHPTLCGMQVTIDGGRLSAVSGDPDNPDSEGFLCVRGHAARDIIDNPQRLLHPRIRDRREDRWREVSWDEAMERILAGMQRAGRERVALWVGHGELANDYGISAHARLARRFANLWGCQNWGSAMICWGLGGFGFGLTGVLEVNTKEDMSANADLVILWGANLVSQPNTARHLARAKQRGARVLAIDVRQSEACRSASDHYLVKPGTDAALALAMMSVIIGEDLYDHQFVSEHTVGFEALRDHVAKLTPEWAAGITGIPARRIRDLARDYAQTERAMVVAGGSSLYKDRNGWMASRAISCLPALTGKLGKPGTGFGPRHAAVSHGFHLNDIAQPQARPSGRYIPDQMSAIVDAVEGGDLDALLLFGSNFLSSFSDTSRIERGLAGMGLVVGHDLFMNETLEQYAHVVLPATSWLEDVGCKGTQTHLYLMDRILDPAGSSRPMHAILKELANRLQVPGFFPWEHEHGHIDAVIDVPATGHATIASLRESGGKAALDISHVAHLDHRYPTPSGKVELFSEQAAAHGLPPLPVYEPRPAVPFPLELRFGRTMNHFHGFYDHGRVLPALVRRDPSPQLWISPADASVRGIEDGAGVELSNQRGSFRAHAKVTDRIPAGTLWMHDGWAGLNRLTDGAAALPDAATTLFAFTTGQSAFDTLVEVTAS